MKTVHLYAIVYICICAGHASTLCLALMSNYTIPFIRYLINLVHLKGNMYLDVSRGYSTRLFVHQVLHEPSPSRLYIRFIHKVNVTPPFASFSLVTIRLLSFWQASLSFNASTHLYPNICLYRTPVIT